MTIPAAPLKHETVKGRFKGSLTGTLVRTLLIFTFIPLALMAGAAYFRARGLLREQAIVQTENLLINQIEVIAREVQAKENKLREQFEGENAPVLIETALHANPQSDQFRSIQARFTNNLLAEENSGYLDSFDAFLLLDKDGNIKIASNEEWQGETINPALFDFDDSQSFLSHNLSPMYDNELVLLTAVNYRTERGSTLGTLVGITEPENLAIILKPLNGLAPYAQTYFILPNGQFFNVNSIEEFQATVVETTSNDQILTELESLKSQPGTASTSLEITLEKDAPILGQLVWLPELQSGILLAIKSQTVYSQINSLAPFTILLALATVAAMGAVLYYGTKRVIQPLQSLSMITRKFAEGDWSQRSEITSANEIGDLSKSFNYLADQIEGSYKSLEQKVQERALQIQTAAEVAQNVTTIPNLDEMLNKTVELLVQQFDFYQTSIFLVDRSGKNVDFKTGYGSATKGLVEQKYSLPVGSASIIGWVAAHNKPRVASDVTEDTLHLKNQLLSETRSEACVPISLGDTVLGILDVQSTQPNAFSADSIVMLQTLASQVAAAIQTARLIESSQINFQELDRLYRSSRIIAEAKNETEILQAGGQILKTSPYPIVLFRLANNNLKVVAVSDIIRNEVPVELLKNGIQVNSQELESYLSRGTVITTYSSPDLPKPFKESLRTLDLSSAAFLPIKGEDAIEAIVLIGSNQQNPSSASIQPYENLAGLMSVTLQRISAVAQTEKHLQEVEALVSVNELVSSVSDTQGFFHALLTKIQQIIGDYNLIVAIYDEPNNSLHIPFSYENGKFQSISPFPLGEGLTSILIRTRQPLMLVKDTERKAAELGAKVVGKPAKSWMGAPMILRGVPIGALIIQDLEHEGVFDEDDLKFFTTIASQVAGVIKNVQLLEESKQKAIQVETAAEIARDISGSLNLDELLLKAVHLIRERFSFYHAGIFLLDLPGEFAVIREATGEAGAQMKRQGYKIGVGSKSIVGFVSGKGEMLVVSDTPKDMTYYPNPLLPDTRAEAAIPMRVGERILGVLDVQSTEPYAFHEDNLRSLQILADQLAVAVANSELFAETQEHLSQHRLLHHITTSAASGTTLEEALESAVSGLQVTLGGDRVMILLTNKDKQMLEVKASVGYAEDITNMKIEVGKGVTGWVAAHRRPLRLRDVSEDPRYIQTSANTKSELAIPLIYRNEVLGVINVESEQLDAYSENDEEMLGTLGGSLAAVIANARLLEQIRAQSERERLINEITTRIRRSTDIQSILHTTASEISRVTGARYTKIQVESKDDQSTDNKRS
jgi:GAF domain-containing protein/HAMP domain-containing protein